METKAPQPQRRKRTQPTAPISKYTGKKVRIRINKRDIEIFRILQRYRYLPINFIYALLPDFGFKAGNGRGDYDDFRERLCNLTGAGYLRRPIKQWHAMYSDTKKIVYENHTHAKAILNLKGFGSDVIIGAGKEFEHEYVTCLVISSMEIQSLNRYRFVHFPEILKLDKVPEETKALPNPMGIPLIDSEQSHQFPDGSAYIIKGSRAVCFLGVETDMESEVQKSLGAKRATIQQKFEGYRNIAYHRTYKKHFGFHNMVIPFVTTSEKRMFNMMEVIRTVFGNKGCPYIIFKHVPHIRYIDKSPEPMDMLGDWLRVGHPPFNIINELEKKV